MTESVILYLLNEILLRVEKGSSIGITENF
jgi:hypothetical protein